MDDEQIDALPAPPPDAFAAALALVAVALDPKSTGARLRSLQAQQAAAAKATAELTTARATFDQETAAARAELAADRADIEKRRLAVHAAEGSLTEREKRQTALEKLWHDIGEPNEVVNGFKDPERPALHKALRAHGRLDVPAPLREDSGGQPFPPHSTITHTPASPPRTAPARRVMRDAAEL
jgi:hypothetical protein